MKKILFSSLFPILFSGCMGYVPGQQSYWDEQVREMCERDGGVRIYEKLRITKADIELLGRVGGKIGVPAKDLANPKAPAYQELKITRIRDGNPRVSRTDLIIVRRADQTVVAQATIYARSGGDFPSPAQTSGYRCPDAKTIMSDLQELFIVEGDSK